MVDIGPSIGTSGAGHQGGNAIGIDGQNSNNLSVNNSTLSQIHGGTANIDINLNSPSYRIISNITISGDGGQGGSATGTTGFEHALNGFATLTGGASEGAQAMGTMNNPELNNIISIRRGASNTASAENDIK